MEQKIQTQKHKMNCGFAVKSLSVVALVCMVIGYIILYCYLYDFVYHDYESNYRVTISALLKLAPVILFLVYSFGFHSRLKATVIVPLVFGIFIVHYVERYVIHPLPSIQDIIAIVACAVVIISALQGFHNKKLFVVAMSVFLLFRGILYTVDVICDCLKYYYGDHLYTFHILENLIICLGECALYVALLLFGLNNTIPVMINVRSGKVKGKLIDVDPELELKTLNEQYALGRLTQEEYETQRAEILRRL